MDRKDYKREGSQHGFTLIELMIALAVGSIILAGLSGALYQLLAASSSNTNNLMALNQVQSAGYWISRDVQQSRIEDIIIDSTQQTAEIFSIAWDELSFDTELIKRGHKVIYRLDNGKLYRDLYVTNENLPYDTAIEDYVYSFEKTTLVAQYINYDISLVKSEIMILTVAATVDRWKTGTAERIYIIDNRLN